MNGNKALGRAEIIAALRCCGNTDTKRPDCEHCPAMGPMCVKRMLEGAAELIEREALRKAAVKATDSSEFVFDNCFPYWRFSKCIKDAPTIDAVPVVHGRVLVNGNPICGPCSKCGESVNRKWNYCPNCGARMDGGVEDAD